MRKDARVSSGGEVIGGGIETGEVQRKGKKGKGREEEKREEEGYKRSARSVEKSVSTEAAREYTRWLGGPARRDSWLAMRRRKG